MSIYDWIIIAAFIIMTIVGFASMGIDKKKAKEGKWRTKEATLFLIAALLGGVGSTAGMFYFHHKTQHWYFRVFFPIFALTSIAITVTIIVLL